MGGKKKHQRQKKENDSDEEGTHYPPEKVQEPAEKEQKEEEDDKPFEPIVPKKVSYCPVCSLTFELCRFGKDAAQCAAFLFKLAPTKVEKYHPNFKPEQIEQLKSTKKGHEQGEQEKPKQQKQKAKLIKQKYVVIDVKNRGKKNFTTTVSGLNNFNIDCKDLSKKCSKKFAVSCSVIETGTVQMQGDNFEAMKEFLLGEYKQLKKKYIIDKEQFNQKQGEETAKKKQARKMQKNAIKEEAEEQEKPEPVKDVNTLRMELMKKAEEQMNEDDD